jgi:hypothetical protein
MATPFTVDRPRNRGLTTGQVRSTTSILAILAAIGSFVLSARGSEFLGVIAAFFAVGAGLIGGVKSLSPRVSGGMLSIVAVLLGVIALVFAVLAMLV